MAKRGKISIIVPVRNASRYLADCVGSVKAQTYSNWELILVDDGSTDGSDELCNRFAREDSRIRVLHQPQSGAAVARNAGLKIACGEYVDFLDADDWIEPEMLEVLAAGMEHCECSICGVQDTECEPMRDEKVFVQEMQKHPSWYAKNVYICYCINRLYCLSLIRENHLIFQPGMCHGEDAEFVVRYLALCRQICVTHKRMYYYRQNESSASHGFMPTICRDEAVLTPLQYGFFHACPLDDEEERAYKIWEHGKCMAVLRHIVDYAPDTESVPIVRQVLDVPRYYNICAFPPVELGPRSKLYAVLLRLRMFGVFANVLKVLR